MPGGGHNPCATSESCAVTNLGRRMRRARFPPAGAAPPSGRGRSPPLFQAGQIQRRRHVGQGHGCNRPWSVGEHRNLRGGEQQRRKAIDATPSPGMSPGARGGVCLLRWRRPCRMPSGPLAWRPLASACPPVYYVRTVQFKEMVYGWTKCKLPALKRLGPSYRPS